MKTPLPAIPSPHELQHTVYNLNEGSARTTRKKTRHRRPLPPLQARDWLTPNETALTLGCSVATVHRLRRGLIPGRELLPCISFGRKVVFRKASVARWQDDNEQRGSA